MNLPTHSCPELERTENFVVSCYQFYGERPNELSGWTNDAVYCQACGIRLNSLLSECEKIGLRLEG